MNEVLFAKFPLCGQGAVVESFEVTSGFARLLSFAAIILGMARLGQSNQQPAHEPERSSRTPMMAGSLSGGTHLPLAVQSGFPKKTDQTSSFRTQTAGMFADESPQMRRNISCYQVDARSKKDCMTRRTNTTRSHDNQRNSGSRSMQRRHGTEH